MASAPTSPLESLRAVRREPTVTHPSKRSPAVPPAVANTMGAGRRRWTLPAGHLLAVWPLPALLAWTVAWAVFALMLRVAEAPAAVATVLGAVCGVVLSRAGATRWRRLFVALGFPLSLAASGLAGALPAWAWLLPLAVLALVYPVNAWRDAPVFPTPRGALAGLASRVSLPATPRILDAGCGLGAGLRELQREFPAARLDGLEWSWPLRWLCAWRCPDARVRRGDIWAADWSGYDLVYLFQRPESMAGALAKAGRELRPGAWLASLEFAVPDVTPTDAMELGAGRRVWLYRMPGSPRRRTPAGSRHQAGF